MSAQTEDELLDKILVVAKVRLSCRQQLTVEVVLCIPDRLTPVSHICSKLENQAETAVNEGSAAASRTIYKVCRGTGVLHYQGVPIKDDNVNRSIDYYIPTWAGKDKTAIYEGFAIDMEAEAEPYTLKVVCPEHKPFHVQMDTCKDKLIELKKKIKEKAGFLICQQRLYCNTGGQAGLLLRDELTLDTSSVVNGSEIQVKLDSSCGFSLSIVSEGHENLVTLEDRTPEGPDSYQVNDVELAYRQAPGCSLPAGWRFFFNNQPLATCDSLSLHHIQPGSKLEIKPYAAFCIEVCVVDKAGFELASISTNSAATVHSIRTKLAGLYPDNQEPDMWNVPIRILEGKQQVLREHQLLMTDSRELGLLADPAKASTKLWLDHYQYPDCRMQLSVTSVMIPLDVKVSETVRGVKGQIQDFAGTPPGQQVLLFSGCELVDGRTLGDYAINSDSRLHMVLRLRGGGASPPEVNPLMGVLLTDTSQQLAKCKTGWSSSAPDWQLASPGLCVEGKCLNCRCKAYNQVVIHNAGFTHFDLILSAENQLLNSRSDCKCPMCKEFIEVAVPITCAFNKCQWKYTGVKLSREGKREVVDLSKWTTVGDSYERLEDKLVTDFQWSRLLIVTKEAKDTCVTQQ